MSNDKPLTTYRLVLQVFEKQQDADEEKECFVAAWLQAHSPDQVKEFDRNNLTAVNCRVIAFWTGPEPVIEWTAANAAAKVRVKADGADFELRAYHKSQKRTATPLSATKH